MKIFDEAFRIKAVATDTVNSELPSLFSEDEVRKVKQFHSSVEGYETTPLIGLDAMARDLGVKGVYVKDESFRFGLNAFKALGGTYSIAKVLCEKLGKDIDEVTFDSLRSDEVKEQIRDLVFVTATDGNHGRGVAWAASKLGCRSVVFLPKGAAETRVEAIRKAGAETRLTDLNYDDAVRLAAKTGEENGWTLVQDTGFEGYEKIPNWISQGYMTMADEAQHQLEELGVEKPTHLFLQAGVGAMAGGVLGYYVNRFGEDSPVTSIVEPNNAACIYKSAVMNDGKPHAVLGDHSTIMAGLACGEPNLVTWEILRDHASVYFACPDFISAVGMRLLACPRGEDRKIISGESGSVGVGLLDFLMTRKELSAIREQLGLDENSVVLLFNTEGDTDPENYKDVIYYGKKAVS